MGEVSKYGSISAQNANPNSGTPTPNSFIQHSVDGAGTVVFQITGNNANQPLSLQGSNDGSTWVTIGGTPLLNLGTGVAAATIAAGTNGLFQAKVAGLRYVRLTQLTGAHTGSATVAANSVPF